MLPRPHARLLRARHRRRAGARCARHRLPGFAGPGRRPRRGRDHGAGGALHLPFPRRQRVAGAPAGPPAGPGRRTGHDMDDIVTARFDYAQARRRPASPTRIRLDSTVVACATRRRRRVGYVRDGKLHRVRGGHGVLAGYHMMIPYIMRGAAGAAARGAGAERKAPLVYTKVAVRNWQPWVAARRARDRRTRWASTRASSSTTREPRRLSSRARPDEPVCCTSCTCPPQGPGR